MKKETVAKFGTKTKRLLIIALTLHSKAPNKQIKEMWEIILFSGLFLVMMNILTGMPFIFGIKLTFPFSTLINQNGGFVFIGFVIMFCILSIPTKKNHKHLNSTK